MLERINWKNPELSDFAWASEAVKKQECIGSDISFANIFLLRNKYNIELANYKGFMLRRYHGEGARLGYTFPVGDTSQREALKECLSAIENDAKSRGEDLRFAFVCVRQRALIEEIFPDRFEFETTPDDSDYIYLQEELANLPGKKFHKKKNHVSKFERSYPNFEYKMLMDNSDDDSLWEALLEVEEIWYKAHEDNNSSSQLLEYESIKEAVKYHRELGLMGGVIFHNEKPVAMTIASRINDETADIHFEKSIGEYAINGGFAAINKYFADSLQGVTYLNREEDIGIEGLRKAKLSYKPYKLIEKYSGKLRK